MDDSQCHMPAYRVQSDKSIVPIGVTFKTNSGQVRTLGIVLYDLIESVDARVAALAPPGFAAPACQAEESVLPI